MPDLNPLILGFLVALGMAAVRVVPGLLLVIAAAWAGALADMRH